MNKVIQGVLITLVGLSVAVLTDAAIPGAAGTILNFGIAFCSGFIGTSKIMEGLG